MDKKRACQAAALLLAAALGLAGLYALRPPCLILERTGFYCAGCGTQRMVAALLRGDIPTACAHYPVLFLALPLAAAYVLWEAHRYIHRKPPLCQIKTTWLSGLLLLAIALAFTVLRNIPGITFLGP